MGITIDDLETIKKEGSIRAIKDKINDLKFRLKNVFDSTMDGNKYIGLSRALNVAREINEGIAFCLKELQRLEPENN